MAGRDARKVRIDVDRLELSDLPTLAMLGDLKGSNWFTRENTTEIIDLLDRVVAGGVRGRGYKISQLAEIAAAVFAAVNEAANPETAEGNSTGD